MPQTFRIVVLLLAQLFVQLLSFSVAAGPKVPADGMVVNSLTVAGPENGPAEIMLSAGESKYAIGARADGSFAISDGKQHAFLSVQEGNIFAHTQVLSAGGLASQSNLAIGETIQWALVATEDYSKSISGWGERCVNICRFSAASSAAQRDRKCLSGSISPCGGVRMLGGFRIFGQGETHKSFTQLRPHEEVRVTGTFHFIDSWEGETGYLMVGTEIRAQNCDDMSYVWTHSFDSRETSGGVNICGDANVPEGRFAVPFDVVVPHQADTLEVVFGSTMQDKAQFDKRANGWWGISGLEVHIR